MLFDLQLNNIFLVLYLKLLNREPVFLTPDQEAIFGFLHVELELLGDNYYLLVSPSLYYPPYDHQLLSKLISVPVQKIYLPFITSSTLDCVQSRSGLDQLEIIIADGQLKGRGQYARTWQSALGRQIQITFGPVLYKRKIAASFWVAYVVLKTILSFNPTLSLQFKWPNDLYLQRSKVAGFLLEQHDNFLTISLGLNMTFSLLSYNLRGLNETDKFFSREKLVASFINRVGEDQVSSDDVLSFLMTRSLFKKNEIVFFKQSDHHEEKVIFLGLNQDGSCSVLKACSQMPISVYHGSLRALS
jgi:biotin-(acetyl-CoA carboxylase) ligase